MRHGLTGWRNLDDFEAEQIRREWVNEPYVSMTELGARHGVHHSVVSRIINGRTHTGPAPLTCAEAADVAQRARPSYAKWQRRAS